MEKKCLAILMNRVVIDEGIYLFKPQCLIEGTLEDSEYDDIYSEYFEDTTHVAHYLMDDVDALNYDNETCVGFIITEKELKKRFKEEGTIQEMKAAYFDEMSLKTWLGFYMEDADRLTIKEFDVFDIKMRLLNGENVDLSKWNVGESKQLNSYNNYDSALADNDGSCIVAFDIDEFKRIIDIKDDDFLRKELKKAYEGAKDLKERFTGKSELDGARLEALYNAAYDGLMSITTLKEMHETLAQIIDMYIDLTVQMDDRAEQGYDVSKAQEYIYSLVDRYDAIKEMQDLNDIKEKLTHIFRTDEPEFRKILESYDDRDDNVMEVKQDEGPTIDAADMKRFFDKRVIGQEEAKIDAISTIIVNSKNKVVENRNSCLLVGPTGSGKTLIAKTAAAYLDVPFEIIDTTQLTVPGYVGGTLEEHLSNLVAKAKGDLKKAEKGIVVFDEIDKKGSKSNSDISGKGVLNTILPFMDGTTYQISYNGRNMQFYTGNLTNFGTGAFTEVVKKAGGDSYNNHSIGFNSDERPDMSHYRHLEPEDFVEYGEVPAELVGRFTTISQLEGHTKDTLKKVLLDSDISALMLEKETFNNFNCDLKWTSGYLDALIEKALKLKTGGRSLKAAIERSVVLARWAVLTAPNKYEAIILSEETVKDNTKFTTIERAQLEEQVKGEIQKQKIKAKN